MLLPNNRLASQSKESITYDPEYLFGGKNQLAIERAETEWANILNQPENVFEERGTILGCSRWLYGKVTFLFEEDESVQDGEKIFTRLKLFFKEGLDTGCCDEQAIKEWFWKAAYFQSLFDTCIKHVSTGDAYDSFRRMTFEDLDKAMEYIDQNISRLLSDDPTFDEYEQLKRFWAQIDVREGYEEYIKKAQSCKNGFATLMMVHEYKKEATPSGKVLELMKAFFDGIEDINKI